MLSFYCFMIFNGEFGGKYFIQTFFTASLMKEKSKKVDKF
jgi:hypothetical protein